MKDKLDDANYGAELAKKEFDKKYIEYHKVISNGSLVDIQFRILMKTLSEREWKIGKDKNKNKIKHLKSKYHKKNRIGNDEFYVRESHIKYRDNELVDLEKQYEGERNEPRMYGETQIGDKAKAVLTKDPNFMILDKIDITEIEVEIEKGLAKARYEWMNSEDNDISDQDITDHISTDTVEENDRGNQQQHMSTYKTVNFADKRATDIPTVQRLYPPKPGKLKQESILENIKMKLLDTTKEYMNKHCDNKGRIKNHNLSNEEKEGIKEIKEKIKEREIVVFQTDKSGRFSIDTPENYEEAVLNHTVNDLEIDDKRVKQIENHINLHGNNSIAYSM